MKPSRSLLAGALAVVTAFGVSACSGTGSSPEETSGPVTITFLVPNDSTSLVLAGLMIPPAVVPTIYVLKGLGLYKSLPGLIMVEVALGLPFAILLFRAFVSSVPREIDEAAIIDGCGPIRMFFQLILPLLRPILITVVLTSGLGVYNDFVMPLYFLPGSEYSTVQLTLFNFQDAEVGSQFNLIFMGMVLISLPPLLLFVFFNRQIVEGMASGAVK